MEAFLVTLASSERLLMESGFDFHFTVESRLILSSQGILEMSSVSCSLSLEVPLGMSSAIPRSAPQYRPQSG